MSFSYLVMQYDQEKMLALGGLNETACSISHSNFTWADILNLNSLMPTSNKESILFHGTRVRCRAESIFTGWRRAVYGNEENDPNEMRKNGRFMELFSE